jgi:hypothetical protein
MPYVVSRVLIPPENIDRQEYSPIEYSCQNLQQQVDRINEAASREDFYSLQPLIQGSLLVQVNEGPKKMAEVFLSGGREDQHTLMLRTIFRHFLEANSKAVQLHAAWAKTNPIYALLQEELESGLNRLRSTLQPFLK